MVSWGNSNAETTAAVQSSFDIKQDNYLQRDLAATDKAKQYRTQNSTHDSLCLFQQSNQKKVDDVSYRSVIIASSAQRIVYT
jgi:hypothetical protein